MFPVLYESPSVIIPTWHVVFFLAVSFSFILYRRLGDIYLKEVLNSDKNMLFLVCYFSGYFGARLLSVIMVDKVTLNINQILLGMSKIGDLTFLGGVFASTLSGFIYLKIKKLPFLKFLDISLPPLLLGLSIGRIGCFLNGCDYGFAVKKNSWWTVTFPNHDNLVPRFPLQIIEALVVFIFLIFILSQFQRLFNKNKSGTIGSYCFLFYSVFRFLNEFLRRDDRGWVIDQILSTSQLASLCIIFFVFLFFSTNSSKKKFQL